MAVLQELSLAMQMQTQKRQCIGRQHCKSQASRVWMIHRDFECWHNRDSPSYHNKTLKAARSDQVLKVQDKLESSLFFSMRFLAHIHAYPRPLKNSLQK